MTQPDIVGPRPEGSSGIPDVDLREFNAAGAANRIIEGARILPEGQDINTFTRNALMGLPFSAKWPTFNELYMRNIYAKDAALDARIKNTEYTQDPVETAVSSYAESLYFPHDKIRTPEELNLRDEIHRSHENFIYFSDFQDMSTRAERGIAFIGVYDGEWQRIQGEKKKKEPDRDDLATSWVMLRRVLTKERDFERRAMDAANPHRPLSPGEDPRYAGAANLEVQWQNYQRILSANEEKRSRTISEIQDVVTTISAVDPILTARIMWDAVLTDKEKAEISNERKKFRKAYGLAAEASYFTDHADPAYQAFRDHEANTRRLGMYHDGWPGQMVALERPTDPIEKILIGDYSQIPHQTQVALQDGSTEGIWEIKDALKFKKSNPLQRHVTDVSLALLYTDIAGTPQK